MLAKKEVRKLKESGDQIDFVIPWVDGSDKEWAEEKSKYDGSNGESVNNSISRYRDWDNLQYFFRGVEKYAPWVHKIYFITWGHLPKWLNTDNPKLVIVNHKDYIPEEYYQDLSYEVRGATMEVYNILGPGLLESVYEKALIHELSLRGIRVDTQLPVKIMYKDAQVGDDLRVDLLVDDTMVLELK